jgi:hypothetical protein
MTTDEVLADKAYSSAANRTHLRIQRPRLDSGQRPGGGSTGVE